QQHVGLASGDLFAGGVDQHPAPVAGEAPGFDECGVEVLAAARLHRVAAQPGECDRHAVSLGSWPRTPTAFVTTFHGRRGTLRGTSGDSEPERAVPETPA